MVAPTPPSASLPDEEFSDESHDLSDESPNTPPEKVSPPIFEHDVNDIKAKDIKDKFRVQYLRKLSQEKVWVPKAQRSPKHQTLIIFDWDDTLMYSHFLIHSAGRIVTPTTRRHLQNIEKAACTLLEKAISLGNTFIVTNAEKGWVEQCVTWHMPSVKPFLAKVPVISARTAHEAECTDVKQWKNRAFLELGKHLDQETITNLVSVGDSNFEMEAVQLLGRQFPHSFIKTVKLKERPSPEELMKELDLITPKFEIMVQRANNLKIRLERRRVDGPE